MAQEFLKEFCPPLPNYISPTLLPPETTSHRIPMAQITEEEITRVVFSTAPLKGLGPDIIPAMVWQNLCPTLKDVVFWLFTTSIQLGIMPDRWKTARIISLRKPQKEDYMIPWLIPPNFVIVYPRKNARSSHSSKTGLFIRHLLFTPI